MITYFTQFPQVEEGLSRKSAYYSLYLNSNVIISASSNNYSCPVNPGGPLTVKYVFKGEEVYLCRNKKFRVMNDRFLIFNEKQRYSSYINTEGKTESFSVFFKPEYVESVLKSVIEDTDKLLENPMYSKNSLQPINFVEKLYSANHDVINIFSALRTSLRKENIQELEYKELLLKLLEVILTANRNILKEINKIDSAKSSTRLELYKRLNNAKDYINSCYSENITLSDLAEISCLCEHHLLRQFRNFYGITPYKYLMITRLESAKNQLINSGKTISQISAETGFEYLSSFTEAFTKKYKISPSAFRKKSI